jgi:hypothetical protein
MHYSTRNYKISSSFLFETIQELRYKDIVRNYFLKVLNPEDPPMTNFDIYDALINLSKFMDDEGYLVFKIEGKHRVCVYRWEQSKPIITVIINIQNVDK